MASIVNKTSLLLIPLLAGTGSGKFLWVMQLAIVKLQLKKPPDWYRGAR